MTCNYTPGHLSQRNGKYVRIPNLYANVCRGIRNSPKLETTQMSCNGWMVKHCSTATLQRPTRQSKGVNYCYRQSSGPTNRELCWVTKANSQRLHVIWLPLYKFLKWQNYRNGEQVSCCQGLTGMWRQEGSVDGSPRAAGCSSVVREMSCTRTLSTSASCFWYCTKIVQDVPLVGN